MRHRPTMLLLGVLAAGCATAPASQPPTTIDAATAARQVLVTVVPPTAPALHGAGSARKYSGARRYSGGAAVASLADDLEAAYGLTHVTGWPIGALGVHCYVFAIADDDEPASVIRRLVADPRVESAQAMGLFELMADGYSDPYFPLQETARALQLAQAHSVTTGAGVTIAVIDTAVDTAHPDLEAARVRRHSFTDTALPPAPGMNHGTAVVGVIAAAADNGIGIVGVAPGAELLALEACWWQGEQSTGAVCSSYTLARALSFALESRARVLNLSLTGTADPLLARLLDVAVARGITVVSADPGEPGAFPASLPGVVAVRADTGVADDSTALMAPGNHVLTLAPGGGYGYSNGSSIASAHVSGVAALLMAYRPALDREAVHRTLKDSAVGASAGVVNACTALALLGRASGCDTSPPVIGARH